MAFASAVVMFAVGPQNFLGLASTEGSFLVLADVLSVYGRYICSELARRAGMLPRSIARALENLTSFYGPKVFLLAGPNSIRRRIGSRRLIGPIVCMERNLILRMIAPRDCGPLL
jgi:hypothetical protein